MKIEKKLLICSKCPYGHDDNSNESFEGIPNTLICEKNNNMLIRGFADLHSCPIGRW